MVVGVQQLVDRSQADDGLFFKLIGPGDLVVVGGKMSQGPLPFDQDIDQEAVFAVKAHCGPQAVRCLQKVVDLILLDHHPVLVGHVGLEGSDTAFDNGGHLPFQILIPLRKTHVETIIDGAVSVRFLMPAFQGMGHGLPLLLGNKVEDGGRAAGQGSPGPRLEIVGRNGAHGFKLEVSVGFDAAGQKIATGAFNDGFAFLG